MEKKYFSSESVTEGHPDKVCDKISDSVLDAILAQDPMARVACETTATTDFVMVMGEITTTAQIDAEKIVRGAIAEIGYNKEEYGFNASTCTFVNRIHKQSPDISQGVTVGEGSIIGAGSVITKDIPPNVIAAGNPCRVIREISKEDKRYWEEKRDQYLKMKD